MNVSSTFGKLKTKQYDLTGKQRLVVLGTIGVIVMLIVYMATSEVEVAVGPNPPSNAQETGKSLSKSENRELQAIPVSQNVRDPFALPPQVKVQNNEISAVPPIPSNSAALVSGMVPKSVGPNVPKANLRLTGIVGSAGRNLAVIMSDDKSKSYSVNEYIGPYKVMAITNDYVVLASGDNKLVLRLETSGQKGGNNSEK